MGRSAAATKFTSMMAVCRYVDAKLGMALVRRCLKNGCLDGRSQLALSVFASSSGDLTVREKNVNLGLVMAIALVLASKKLQRHTGVAAEDWRKELMQQAIARLNSWAVEKIERFIANNYTK